MQPVGFFYAHSRFRGKTMAKSLRWRWVFLTDMLDSVHFSLRPREMSYGVVNQKWGSRYRLGTLPG
jgi:hypothetical protein